MYVHESDSVGLEHFRNAAIILPDYHYCRTENNQVLTYDDNQNPEYEVIGENKGRNTPSVSNGFQNMAMNECVAYHGSSVANEGEDVHHMYEMDDIPPTMHATGRKEFNMEECVAYGSSEVAVAGGQHTDRHDYELV